MRTFKYFFVYLLLFMGVAVVGCRSNSAPQPSLVPETQTVPVFSDPSEAKVILDGIPQGETPLSLNLEKNRDHMIVVMKEGYKPEAIPVSRKLIAQDLAMKSLLRMTDPVSSNESRNPFEEIKVNEITGRAYQLQPQVINITLQRMGQQSAPSAEQKMAAPQ